MIIYITYFLAIAAAELVTVYVNPVWGTVCHAAVLAALLVHAALERTQARQRFLTALALAPLVRIVSLAMPLTAIPRIWWYPVIYTPLLAAALVTMHLQGYHRRQVGLTFRFSWLQLGVFGAGALLGLGEYLILRPEPLISELTWASVWLPALIFLLAVGFVEEVLFRGVMQTASAPLMGKWAIIYISGIFALLHMGFYSWLDVVFVFGIAVFFGWAVKKERSLVGVTFAHGIANTMLYLIAPFLLN